MNDIEMDYKSIGKRIREIRINNDLQQFELANRAGLTAAHMSHIETGSTKLSLPTITRIANALSVSIDDLMCDNLKKVKPTYDKKITAVLEDCDAAELKAIFEIIRTVKAALRAKYANSAED